MPRHKLSRKALIEFVVLIGIAAICLYFVVMMLFNSHPRVVPAVKNGGSQSRVIRPVARPEARAIPI